MPVWYRMKLTEFVALILVCLRSVSAMTSGTSPSASGLPFPKMLGPDSDQNVEFTSGNGSDVLSVPTKLNYVASEVKEINVRRSVAGLDSVYEGAVWASPNVPIYNARVAESSPSLDCHGFEVYQAPVEQDENIDFRKTDTVIDHYYPQVEAFMKKALGDQVAVVKAFDHNIRINANSYGNKLEGGGTAQVPLGIVHGDYTAVSGPRRIQDLAKVPKSNDTLKSRLGTTPLLDASMVQEAVEGKRRYALINLWRSIDRENPVMELPLACMDARTFDAEADLRTLFLHYSDRIGENYVVVPNQKHKWWYFPCMSYEEALLIKQWDSFGDFARARNQVVAGHPDLPSIDEHSTFAIHSAFMDPTSKEGCPPRKSIEVRCVVIWNKE